MNALAGFAGAILNTIRSWVGLVLPIFAKAGDFRSWPRWAWQTIHFAILAAVLVGLYFLNRFLKIQDTYLLRHADLLGQFYLPIVFLLLYVLCWAGYFIWKILGEGEASGEFPDIEAAWSEATAKLYDQGIDLADAPLYLILGRPSAGEDAFFQAGGQQIAVRSPTAANSPIRIHAHRDAIYVTCGGASAWGQFASMLGGEADSSPSIPGAAPFAADKTIQFGAEALGVSPEFIDELRELLAKQQQRDLTPEEKARLQELAELTKGPAGGKRRTQPMSAEAMTRGAARLRYLCRLIRRDRAPWCPINGMLVLAPWAATDSDEVAKEAAGVLQRDLVAARDALQLRYPTIALVCDLELARGFAEFRRSFAPDAIQKSRIGQRLPLAPDVPPAEVAGLLERGVQWIGQTVLPAGIVKFLRMEPVPQPGKPAPVVASNHNRNLYLLLNQVYQRGPRLARILSRGLQGGSANEYADPLDALPLFGGCYLAGTGRAETDQAFVRAVLTRLMDAQSSVSWTSQAIAEDARYRRLTVLGYAAMALLVAIGLVVAWQQWPKTTGDAQKVAIRLLK